MRLKSIDVSGFRGFATRKSFDLSADAIVVVGSNGLGKTSLLDAIHWGMCGKLGRIDGGDDKLVSMYSPTGQARVALTLADRDQEITITRVFDGYTQSLQASIGGKHFKETSARARILELLWPEAASAKDGDESLSAALTRSVYLQQDRLRDFLDNATDQERFNVISELVGAGRLTELQSELESESRSWSRATTQLSKDLAPLVNRVEALQTQLASLRKSAAVGSEFQESQWNNWWETCRSCGVSVPDVPTPTSADAASTLDKALRDIRAMRDSSRRRRSLIESAIQFELLEPPKPLESIEKLEGEAAESTLKTASAAAALKAAQGRAAATRKRQVEAHEAREQHRALAQLAIALLDSSCPVCQQSYDVEATRLRLKGIIEFGAETATNTEVAESIEEYAKAEKDAVEAEAEVRKKLADAERLQKQHAQWDLERNERFSELEISANQVSVKALEAMLNECDSQEGRLRNLTTEGEALSLNIAREAANARISSTEADLRKAEVESAIHQLEMVKRERTSVTTKLLIEQLRDARSTVAIDKLSEIEPLLQRIFSRIDPHPTFRVVSFATDVIRGKGRLDAEIRDSAEGKSSRTPAAIFSSSQLNALAVSVFLSFNLALPHLPIQAALLDDPIQSLDEINLLGLVDLLRRTKEKRQIVVSTHDGKFGRLLARKLRPANADQRTSVIELRGWNRTGPEVIQYPVEADRTPLRLAVVS
ncbi:AAA family ATPase [Botrimarina mediterranea]|uniref:Chromosome partition protein Smc n=1 Tax=Botrimarina mediterranea TaxID=2528022 RepID=A0A518K931_9BACT|nr:AAA family ATPase [Botrimarina mediterranea]QDV74283.1 Chromosome partition protein Smc [Botrimarina mediterranea]